MGTTNGGKLTTDAAVRGQTIFCYQYINVVIVSDPGLEDASVRKLDAILSPSWLRQYLQLAIYVYQCTWLLLVTWSTFFWSHTHVMNSPGHVIHNSDHMVLTSDHVVKTSEHVSQGHVTGDGDKSCKVKECTNMGDDVIGRMDQSHALLLYSITMQTLTVSNLFSSRNESLEITTCIIALMTSCYVTYHVISPRMRSRYFRILPEMHNEYKYTSDVTEAVGVFVANGLAALTAWIVVRLDLVLLRLVKRLIFTELGPALIIGIVTLQGVVMVIIDKMLINRGYKYLLSPYSVAALAVTAMTNYRAMTNLGVVLPVLTGVLLVILTYRLAFVVHHLTTRRSDSQLWTVDTHNIQK